MAFPHPIQNSEVYVFATPSPSFDSPCTPPSPRSPPINCGIDLSPLPLEALSPLTEASLDSSASHDAQTTSRVQAALHVLSTEAAALTHLASLYRATPSFQSSFSRAISLMSSALSSNHKLVLCGVGKSGHIARKLVATFNSLRLTSTYLHPTEALHGDLGVLGPGDVLLLITYSGRTPELTQLLAHVPRSTALVVLTGERDPAACTVLHGGHEDAVLLPAAVHEPEHVSFGVKAPTTSTTCALALGDALAMVLAGETHGYGEGMASVFGACHPGGAIGAAGPDRSNAVIAAASPVSSPAMSAEPGGPAAPVLVALEDMPVIEDSAGVAELVLAAYRSPSGFVRLAGGAVALPSRLRDLAAADMNLRIADVAKIVAERDDWFEIDALDASARLGIWPPGRSGIVAVLRDGRVIGVAEVQ